VWCAVKLAVAQKGIGRYSAFHMGGEGRVVVAFRGERGEAQSVARADVQNRRNG
jgi:hypothetical protein